ncbi:hypothetical protein JCM12294_34240 [Desulfocicer niacini]
MVWLNPEQELFWGTGDSEMYRHCHHCNEVRAGPYPKVADVLVKPEIHDIAQLPVTL